MERQRGESELKGGRNGKGKMNGSLKYFSSPDYDSARRVCKVTGGIESETKGHGEKEKFVRRL